MRRREFISLIGGLAVARPLAARAQQPAKLARIGWLGIGLAAASEKRIEALRVGLRELGYVEGKTFVLEFRWATTVDQLSGLAVELVRAGVNVIFAPSSTEVEVARAATTSIPIIFAAHADPVAVGHVTSLARPGGNITGRSVLLTDLVAKQLATLKEALPNATRIGILWNPTAPSHQPALKALGTAGDQLGVHLVYAPARSADDIDAALAAFGNEGVHGCLVVASALFTAERISLARIMLRFRLPGMFGTKESVEDGGLMSYSVDFPDSIRRAAIYIDRILKGTKPADLPVEQASKYELVINLKTAAALNIAVPPLLLARADEVIE
jgi:putative ABC transport system substrate-binding protein